MSVYFATMLCLICLGINIVIVIILTKLLLKYSLEEPEERTDEDLREEYRTWHMAFGGMVFLFSLVVGFIWLIIFRTCAQTALPADSAVLFFTVPSNFFWFVISFIITIGTIGAPTHFFIKTVLLGDKRYVEYMAYANSQLGFLEITIYPKIAVAVSIVMAVVMYFTINTYTLFYGPKMVTSSFWSFSKKVYEYKEIKKIYSVSKKSDTTPETYVVEFADGKYWRTDKGARDTDLDNDREIIEYLAGATELEVQSTSKYP